MTHPHSDSLLTEPPAAPFQPRPSALPVAERSYPHFLRTPRARWWKGLLAIVLVVVAYLVVSGVFGTIAIVIDLATGAVNLEDDAEGLPFTPTMLIAVNVGAAAMIPLSMLIQRLMFGQSVRWLNSVQGRFRWGWLGRAALVVVPVYVVLLVGWSAIEGIPLTGGNHVALYLAIILLSTPFQAAGEEYAARGLINRAAGSWFASPVLAVIVATVVNSALFMVAHGASDPWLISYYLMFGVIMSLLAWRTGGLEAPILLHCANNVSAFIPTVLAGKMDEVFDRGAGAGGPVMLIPMAVGLVTVGLVEWRARRTGLVTRNAPASGEDAARMVGSTA